MSGCGNSGGSAPTEISFSESKGDTGYIQLTVTDSKNLSASKYAQIEKYKVILDGEDLSPIEQVFSKDANGVVINKIPAGSKRRIRVLALNVQDKSLREGVVENVVVEPEKVTDISVRLQSIPVFMNLSDGDYVSNQRLNFKILTDPNHFLSVEEERALTDVVTSLNQVPANEKGEAKHYPGILPAGDHHFTAVDTDTGRSSTITLHLWDGAKIKAAPLFSTSQVHNRLGQSLARQSSSSFKGGEFFANIAEALWNTR